MREQTTSARPLQSPNTAAKLKSVTVSHRPFIRPGCAGKSAFYGSGRAVEPQQEDAGRRIQLILIAEISAVPVAASEPQAAATVERDRRSEGRAAGLRAA